MSTSAKDPTTVRKLVFDTALFAYSLMVSAYFAFVILAAGGSVIDQDFFLERMSTIGMIAFGCLVTAFGLSLLFHRLEIQTVAANLFSRAASATPKRFVQFHLFFLFAASLMISIQVTEASLLELLDRDGLSGAFRMWSGLTHPNFALLGKAILEAVSTIYIAFLATVIAVPIAFCLSFLTSKNLMNNFAARFVYFSLRLFANVTRSVEPLIWALIFTVWVGVGPFAGMLALMVHSVASLTKYYSEIIESVNEGPLDAVRSTGADKIQTIWFAVVPQVILPFIAMTLYLWDTNVRMATVIGLVGGGGIGTLLITYQGQAMWPEVGCIILVIAAIVWLMDLASAYIREALK